MQILFKSPSLPSALLFGADTSQGNCKFGAKCALAHVLPDGRRVNRHNLSMGGGHLNLGGRVNPENYHNQGSALANSLLQANMVNGPFGPQYPYQSKEDMSPSQNHPTQYFDSIPTIDTSFPVSNPGSKYGSPRDDMRLPVSPVSKGLSVLDAPLPASFDSNGVSWIARNGPVAASVPSKFGLDSPSLSYKETAALKNLHDSAFGQDGRSRPNNTASSPPGPGEVAGLRPMHSQRVSKPKTMSASVPRAGTVDEWDGNFTFEEDFLPNSLQELFTPQEKMRRLSRSGGDDDGVKIRSGLGSPGEPSSKIGSPTASSPSRFGALFARQKKDEDAAGPTSGFGHVGSPLRNSSLTLGSSPGVRSTTRPTSGDMSPYFASPPRQSSMSMISQQLQRTRLSRNDSGGGGTSSNTNGGSGLDSGLHPSSARAGANGRMDRPVSASTASLGTGRAVASIDEEPAEVFSMEEEEDTKRYSGGFAYPTGGRSPQFGTIGAGRSISGSGVPVSSPPEGREGKEYLEALYRNGGQ